MKAPDKKPAIRLRPMGVEDFDFFQSLYTDERVMADICDVFTPEQCASSFDYYFSQAYKDSSSRIRLIENEQEEPMGLTQLAYKAKCRFSAEFGIMMSPAFFGQGVTRRAHELLIKEACNETPLACTYALCNVNNQAANVMCEGFGYVSTRSHINEYGTHRIWRLVIGKQSFM